MILNTDTNIDYLKEPLFLGSSLGLQRYDRFKYPIFFELFKKQLSFFWRPEEINLTLDRSQFKSLDEHEKFIFTKNLLFQTMLDSVIARGVPYFTKYVSNAELELCMNVWGFFENIHSYSYTYIIKNVFADPSSLLDEALKDKEILKRAKNSAAAYDKLAEFGTKEQIYLSLIAVNILEAVRFYVSFVCAFCFGENKKMVGNADIIKLIRRDEAVHLFTTQTIINILRNDENEGFVDTVNSLQDLAIQMFMEAAQEEKEWASYLFQYGSMLGLNEQILHQYIEFITDTRMKDLGLPKQFHTKNPISGWITPWLESESLQVSPQETEILSYKIGSIKNDINELNLQNFEL